MHETLDFGREVTVMCMYSIFKIFSFISAPRSPKELLRDWLIYEASFEVPMESALCDLIQFHCHAKHEVWFPGSCKKL